LKIVNGIPEEKRHLLYVTHHIEELTSAITHVLLVKDGGIVAAGPKKEVLTGKQLSDTYKTPVKVYFENERPWLVIDNVEGDDDYVISVGIDFSRHIIYPCPCIRGGAGYFF